MLVGYWFKMHDDIQSNDRVDAKYTFMGHACTAIGHLKSTATQAHLIKVSRVRK